jgi:hypothetical protein
MAPANEYLSDTTVAPLVEHDPRLVKRTTIESFTGEPPEVHLDFRRNIEQESLAAYLDRFAEPDFVDGKVTLQDAAEHVYGTAALAIAPPEPLKPDYLLRRTSGFLQPQSDFNAKHAVNGLVYISVGDKISRSDREAIAKALLDDVLDAADKRLHTVAAVQQRKILSAAKKATKVDPTGRTALSAHTTGRMAEIGDSLWNDEEAAE